MVEIGEDLYIFKFGGQMILSGLLEVTNLMTLPRIRPCHRKG